MAESRGVGRSPRRCREGLLVGVRPRYVLGHATCLVLKPCDVFSISPAFASCVR